MDIVEKLRNQALGYGTKLECAAADEIERLRRLAKASPGQRSERGRP